MAAREESAAPRRSLYAAPEPVEREVRLSPAFAWLTDNPPSPKEETIFSPGAAGAMCFLSKVKCAAAANTERERDRAEHELRRFLKDAIPPPDWQKCKWLGPKEVQAIEACLTWRAPPLRVGRWARAGV